ncbi:Mak10 protein [Saccharomycopsis crataegensis]|uniref:Mak10 protein n=1 Tax=Saccharomycopsis crataegensis TaxID=43959 RepID=A0AAV5QGI0_9ASCO|nr:Mak10 protein [Saccharomycopsis crataegensis]
MAENAFVPQIDILNTQFTDVTSLFLSLSASSIPPNQVVQSSSFALFEGTHALEIANKHLDTSALTFPATESTVADFNFNNDSPLQFDDIIIIVDKLFRLTFLWLENNQMLSTTVLSCVYVEKLLLNYTKGKKITTKQDSLKFATLWDYQTEEELDQLYSQLKSYQKEYLQLSQTDGQSPRARFLKNYILTHTTFRSLLIGLVNIMSQLIQLFRSGVVYEEEDVISQLPQGLEVWNKMEDSVCQELVMGDIWAKKVECVTEADAATTNGLKLELLLSYSNIFKKMNELTRLLTRSFNLTNSNNDTIGIGYGSEFVDNVDASTPTNPNPTQVNTEFLESMVSSLSFFESKQPEVTKIIQTNTNIYSAQCFSQGIQKRLSNTRPLNKLPASEDIAGMSYAVINVRYFKSLMNWLKEVNYLMANFNVTNFRRFLELVFWKSGSVGSFDCGTTWGETVVWRSWVQLFMIRDNKSLFGSDVKLCEVMLGQMNWFAGIESGWLNMAFGGCQPEHPRVNASSSNNVQHQGVFGIIDTDPMEFIQRDLSIPKSYHGGDAVGLPPKPQKKNKKKSKSKTRSPADVGSLSLSSFNGEAPASIMRSLEMIINYDLVFMESAKTPYYCSSSNIKVSHREKLTELLGQVESTVFEWMSNISNNPSRQRQILSRSIVNFDSLQVAAERFDLWTHEELGIKEYTQFVPRKQQLSAILRDLPPALPFATYVYYLKLQTMLQYLLKGTPLQIYKPWEWSCVNWYGAYFADNLIIVLNRMKQCNTAKMQKLRYKIREVEKLENPAKFAKLVELMKQDLVFKYHLSEVNKFAGTTTTTTSSSSSSQSVYKTYNHQCLEILQLKLAKLMKVEDSLLDEMNYYESLKSMCRGTHQLLEVYSNLGVSVVCKPEFTWIETVIAKASSSSSSSVGFSDDDSFMAKLFGLRFKSFSSVGVPDPLTFSQFVIATTKDQKYLSDNNMVNWGLLKSNFDSILLEFSRTKKLVKDQLDKLEKESSDGVSNSFGKYNQLTNLLKCSIQHSLTIFKTKQMIETLEPESPIMSKTDIAKLIKSQNYAGEIQYEVGEGEASWFPLVKLVKK